MAWRAWRTRGACGEGVVVLADDGEEEEEEEAKAVASVHGCESQGGIRPCGRCLARPGDMWSRSSHRQSRHQNRIERSMTRPTRRPGQLLCGMSSRARRRGCHQSSVTCPRGAGETKMRARAGAGRCQDRTRPGLGLGLGLGRRQPSGRGRHDTRRIYPCWRGLGGSVAASAATRSATMDGWTGGCRDPHASRY